MSLKPSPMQPVPEETARIARAAFPKGNPYLTLRDELGPIFRDEDFADLFPLEGQPALPPWRLALVTIMQFRYSRRIEDDRLPKSKEQRAAYAQTVGDDGFLLLDLLQQSDAPRQVDQLQSLEALRCGLARHYDRTETGSEGQKQYQIRFKANKELASAAEAIESPYDLDARFRSRYEMAWTGYQVHLTETCDDEAVHLITHVETTEATVHESQKTQTIHQALVDKGLPPDQHLVDSAYIDAELLVNSREDFNITLVGPGRLDNSWQAKVEGAYDRYCFEIDWEQKRLRCPQGHYSVIWRDLADTYGPYHQILFDRQTVSSQKSVGTNRIMS